MLQLRHFDLHFAFTCAGALGEDVENQCGSIENLAIKNPLQVPRLGRRKFIIKNHRVHFSPFANLCKLRRLSFSNEGRNVRFVHSLCSLPNDLRSGGDRELSQFFHRFANLNCPALLELYSNEKNPLGLVVLFRECLQVS